MLEKYQDAMIAAVRRFGERKEVVLLFRSSAVGVVGISRRRSLDESGRGLLARLHGCASTIW